MKTGYSTKNTIGFSEEELNNLNTVNAELQNRITSSGVEIGSSEYFDLMQKFLDDIQ